MRSPSTVALAVVLAASGCVADEPPATVGIPGSGCTATVDVPEISPVSTGDPASLYADDALALFELELPGPTYGDMCEKAKAYADYLWDRDHRDDVPEVLQQYSPADLVFQGVRYPNVGVRFRGRTTIYAHFYDHDDPVPGALDACRARRLAEKPSLKISLDAFGEEHEIAGQQTFNLIAREGSDSEYLREVLAQKLTREFGVEAPRSSHARLCLDGEYEGLFSLIEEADTQRFLNQHFPGAADGDYWKVESDGDQYWHERWDESGNWVGDYEPKAGTSPDQPGRLRDLLLLGSRIDEGAPTAEIQDGIDDLLNVEQWLREIAVELSIPDYDGMFGNHKNHLLYDHPDGFRVVPFDRDIAFVDIVDYSAGRCPGDILGGHPCWASNRAGPSIAAWLVEHQEGAYLATVRAFVDDVYDADALASWIHARADAMRPWIVADRYYQPDSPACAADADCDYFTVDGWEYAVRTTLVEDVAERVAAVRSQLDGTPTCSEPCGD